MLSLMRPLFPSIRLPLFQFLQLRLLVSLSLLILCLALLQGCPQTPTKPDAAPTTLQTFQTIYGDSVGALSLIDSSADAFYKAGAITKAQGQVVLHVTEQAKSTLDAAYSAAQLGDTALASANLAAALGPIAILSACLTAKPLTADSFGKCTEKLQAPAAVQS